MTIPREVGQMALDALEILAKYENPLTKIQVRKPLSGGPIVTIYPHKVAADAAEALRTALAQPEQEPTRSQKMRDAGITRRPKGWDKEQELEGINEVILNSIRDSSEVVAPPQREWVDLTDKEHEQIAIDWGCVSADWVLYGAAVERKLKEKNT